MTPKITIIDYGVGNLCSVGKAVSLFTDDWIITEDPDVVDSASAIILPGVGSFESGMKGLDIRNLTDTVKKIAMLGKPVLGICLGAQLLLTKGFEFGEFDGLNIIPGKAVKFSGLLENERIPHVGWNNVNPKIKTWKDTIFEDISEGFSAYFVHSYIFDPDDEEYVAGVTSYGGKEFCSIIKKGNIYGCQFHPEKSGQVGLSIIKNFIGSI